MTPHVEHDGRVITISSTTVSVRIPFILKMPQGISITIDPPAILIYFCAYSNNYIVYKHNIKIEVKTYGL